MADNLGRVNPVSPRFLDRGMREEPYQGRHPKKQHGQHQGGSGEDLDDSADDGSGKPAAKNHIDLRI